MHLITRTIAAGLLAGPAAVAEPAIDVPILGTIRGTTLTITGSGFGSPGSDAAVIARDADGRFRIPSTAAVVRSWSDAEIVLAIDDTVRSGAIRVETADGLSNPARVDVYVYDWFDIPPTPGTNALPLDIDVDAEGGVWVNQEFHRAFQHLDPQVGVVEGRPIPMPPDPGPFATTLFGDHRTQTSMLGEDVLVDPEGCVWFTQGGGYLYSGAFPNHSRIVRYDPDAAEGERHRVYNMPGDRNEIIGLAWDEARGRMWVAQGGLERHPVIASFDPEHFPWDNEFDFSEPLDHLVCAEGEPDDDCLRVYPLPKDHLQPAHLALDERGLVWYTAYWGNRIGVLNPDTGRVLGCPLPEPIGKGDPVPVVGSGPWQIATAPDDGDIVFCEFFDSTIGRFDAARILDPRCRELAADGSNPCIEERLLPDADLEHERIHSIAFDPEGRLWFTITASSPKAPDASLGFITPDWSHVVRLPSLGGFPADDIADSAGIAIDPATGAVWFSEFKRKRIGRLRRIE